MPTLVWQENGKEHRWACYTDPAFAGCMQTQHCRCKQETRSPHAHWNPRLAKQQPLWIVPSQQGMPAPPLLYTALCPQKLTPAPVCVPSIPSTAWLSCPLCLSSLYESLICNEYLEDLAPGHLPSSPAEAAAVRLLIDQFGAKVGPAFGKVMFGGGEGDAAAAAGKELDDALRWVTRVTDRQLGGFDCMHCLSCSHEGGSMCWLVMPCVGRLQGVSRQVARGYQGVG